MWLFSDAIANFPLPVADAEQLSRLTSSFSDQLTFSFQYHWRPLPVVATRSSNAAERIVDDHATHGRCRIASAISDNSITCLSVLQSVGDVH
jgi:hypothetical protein